MKKILILSLFLINVLLFSQEKKETQIHKIATNSETKTIYLLGGIASVITEKDIEFQKEYNIAYYDFGCVAPVNFEEYEENNMHVFSILFSKYDSKWFEKINPTSIGWSAWLKQKTKK